MWRRVNHYWRIITTGFSFAVFGLGGIIFTLIVFPLQRLIYRDPEIRRIKARRLVHYTFKFFISMMSVLGVFSFKLHDKEKFKKLNGQLVLANHPSLIDVVVLISMIPNADCVVKAHLFKNPFMRGVITNTGYISNEDPDGLLDDCKKTLENGNNLIVFPEGTRTVPGQQLKFKRGAANIALRCNAPVTLSLISMNPSSLTKAEPWYKVASRKAQFEIKLATNQPQEHVYASEQQAIKARQYTKNLEKFYLQELKVNE